MLYSRLIALATALAIFTPGSGLRAEDHGPGRDSGRYSAPSYPRAAWGPEARETNYPEVVRLDCTISGCGATLLANKSGGSVGWAATAAHCINGKPQPCRITAAGKTSQVYCHAYSQAESSGADIAFCRFETPITTDAGACLATRAPTQGERLELTGYGFNPWEKSGVPPQRSITVPVLTERESIGPDGTRGRRIFNDRGSIHLTDGRNSVFSGDSGGAGTRRIPGTRPVLVGVISSFASEEPTMSVLGDLTSKHFALAAAEVAALGRGTLDEVCREGGANPLPAPSATATPSGKGTLVHDIVKGSPGENAGFKKGDRVLSLNGKSADTSEAWRVLIKRTLDSNPKDLQFIVQRDGKEVPLSVPTDAVQKNHGVVGLYLTAPPDGRPRQEAPPAQRVRIDEVLTGTAAEAAGLKVGDELLTVNGQPADSPEHWKEVIQGAIGNPKLRHLVFQVKRGAEEKLILVDAAKSREKKMVGIRISAADSAPHDPAPLPLPDVPVPSQTPTASPTPTPGSKPDATALPKIIVRIYGGPRCPACVALKAQLSTMDWTGVDGGKPVEIEGAAPFANSIPAVQVTIEGAPGLSFNRTSGAATVEQINRFVAEARKAVEAYKRGK